MSSRRSKYGHRGEDVIREMGIDLSPDPYWEEHDAQRAQAGKGNDRWTEHRDYLTAEQWQAIYAKPARDQAGAVVWYLHRAYTERGTPEAERLSDDRIMKRFRKDRKIKGA